MLAITRAAEELLGWRWLQQRVTDYSRGKMMFYKYLSQFAVLLVALTTALPGYSEAVDQKLQDELRNKLVSPGGGVEVGEIKATPIPGIYQAQLVNGPLIYASENGEFFIVGDMFAVGASGYVNITEQGRNDARQLQLAAIDAKDMIIFEADGETRGTVTVFTDVTCGYCQKLHQEVPELNSRGIEVRYLAYPRTGLGSDGFRMLVTAWCADDQKATLTRLKNREKVADNLCENNPVSQQYMLGQQMGVRGTPALVLDNGQMIAGYRTPDQLESALGLAATN